MTIKNIKDLKKCQIICRNLKQVKNCFNYLEKLGLRKSYINIDNWFIIKYNKISSIFHNENDIEEETKVEFYDKNFVKTLQKLIKQKEEKVEDFEVAEDGRVIKINNFTSEKEIFICTSMYTSMKENKIKELEPTWLEYVVKLGLVYATLEARERAVFKLEIETKLKNIAERLNKGQKIDWNDEKQGKFYIFYHYPRKSLGCEPNFYSNYQGIIYCLNENFLEVAKKEIGEENLIKYFTEEE